MFKRIFADLHIHIGRDLYGRHVKISASPHLTLRNILEEASRHKGIELIGVIDCHVPAVLEEIEGLVDRKEAEVLQDGGLRFESVTLLFGTELEIFDEFSSGPFHVLVYFPTIEKMSYFSHWLKDKMKNIQLSSQRIYCPARQVQETVKKLEGLFIPAHVFTPFKSLYGRGIKSTLTEVLNPEKIDAIELGLSSDVEMADRIAELHAYPYLANSDSHSLQKIGREYQEIKVKAASFQEFAYSLQKEKGRKIVSYYGMNPYLGKYYRTVCQACFSEVKSSNQICPNCKQKKVIKGVWDRIEELKSVGHERPRRPPYIYQVPLEYIPGLGPKTLTSLLNAFGTEMNVIHHVSLNELKQVTTDQIAQRIVQMREGKLRIEAGGAGKYGRVLD